MTSVVHFLFFTIVAAYAYKCNEEGCSINHTEDNSNFDQPRNEYLVLEDARSIKRPAPYGVVARPAQRMKISSKMEDGTRKENGSYKILNENPRNYPKISSRTGGAAEDRVVFPGPTSDTFVPVIPEECKRNGICEDVPNYPEEAVANLVASEDPEPQQFPGHVGAHIVRRNAPVLATIKEQAKQLVNRLNETDEFIPQIPKECEKKFICDTVLNLPDNLEEFYKIHQHKLATYFANDPEYQFIEREGDTSEGTSLCNTIRRPVRPNSALLDKLGQLRLVVMPENVTVYAQTCDDEGDEQCSYSDAATVELQKGYTKACAQRFLSAHLPVYEQKNKTFKVKEMQIPSCCECLIKPLPQTVRN